MATTAQKGLLSQLFFLALGPIVCWLLKDLEPLPGMTENGMRCMAGCAWILIWWMSEVLPMPITSMMSIPVFAFLGVMPAGKVFAAFGTGPCMLVFGATLIIGLLKESNFIERYAYWSLNLPFVKGSSAGLLFMFAMSAGILSAIAPNIPLAILFSSVALTIGRSCSIDRKNGVMRSLAVLSAVAPAVGGAGTPLGGAPNLVVIGLIAATLHHEVTFWEWTAIGLPMTILQLVVMFALCWIIFPVRGENAKLPVPEGYLEGKLESLGPVSRYEKIAMSIMAIALLLWFAGPQMAEAIGWKAGVKLLGAPSVAIFMGLATFLVPLSRNMTSGRLIFSMDYKKAVHHVAWDILMIQVGTITFGSVLLMGGVDKWAAGLIQEALSGVSGVWVWFGMILLTALASQIVSNLALVALLLPITASLATSFGFPPLAACLSVGFACNVAVMFPFSSLTGAAAMMGCAEYFNKNDFAWYGFWTAILMSVTTFLFCYIVAPLLVG